MDFAEWLFSSSAYWKEMNGLFMPVRLFLYVQTMEKLQLYSPRRLCYNSLALGVSRCTGQEISACREASLGRSKLGRNGDCSGTSAPIRLKKEDWKEKDSAETLTVFGGIILKTIRSNFAAGARAVPLKQRDEAAIRSAASLFAFLYGE